MLSQRFRKEIRALGRRKGRELHNACLVEGERSVASALAAEADVSFLVHSKAFTRAAVVEMALVAKIDAFEVDEKEMRILSGVRTPQGVIAVVKSPLVNPDHLFDLNTVLIMDGIQDPGNAGTLIRTAAWFGVEGVLVPVGTVDPVSPKVIRSSMGGIWDVKLAKTGSVCDWLTQWQVYGGSVVAADLSGEPYQSWDPDVKTALIIGGEANGLTHAVRSAVSEFVQIPRPGAAIEAAAGARPGTESLNAAVAGGILLAHWRTVSAR